MTDGGSDAVNIVGDHATYLGLAAVGFAVHYGLLLALFRNEQAVQKVLINFRSILGRS